jgi:hypothetical protein
MLSSNGSLKSQFEEGYLKSLVEQVDIIGKADLGCDAVDIVFLRIHACQIVQLCDELLRLDSTPAA